MTSWHGRAIALPHKQMKDASVYVAIVPEPAKRSNTMARPKKQRVTNITLTEEQWDIVLDSIHSDINSYIDGDPNIATWSYCWLAPRMQLHTVLKNKLLNKFPKEAA